MIVEGWSLIIGKLSLKCFTILWHCVVLPDLSQPSKMIKAPLLVVALIFGVEFSKKIFYNFEEEAFL